MSFVVFYSLVLVMNKKIGFEETPDKDELKQYWLGSMPEVVLNEKDHLQYIDQVGLMHWVNQVAAKANGRGERNDTHVN